MTLIDEILAQKAALEAKNAVSMELVLGTDVFEQLLFRTRHHIRAEAPSVAIHSDDVEKIQKDDPEHEDARLPAKFLGMSWSFDPKMTDWNLVATFPAKPGSKV